MRKNKIQLFNKRSNTVLFILSAEFMLKQACRVTYLKILSKYIFTVLDFWQKPTFDPILLDFNTRAESSSISERTTVFQAFQRPQV